jgi:NAD(P)-dependent dehydrogenase (short-subunit alcohol dehydrogenase family)
MARWPSPEVIMESERLVVLVTGASSGLGEACARALAGRGHRVYAASRRADAGGAAPTAGAPVPIAMDVTDDASVSEGVRALLAREGRLDVVINNAGVGLAGSVEDTAVEEARALFETNLFGVHRVCRATLPVLRTQGRGLVVNVGSIGGRVSIPFQGFYSASKSALDALTSALRCELAPYGVRVVLVEPGDFRTGFTARRTFARAGAHSPYAERCERVVGVMESDERAGADPEVAASLVVRIVEGRAPGGRHLTGKLAQQLVARLAPWLPDAVLARALRAYYG